MTEQAEKKWEEWDLDNARRMDALVEQGEKVSRESREAVLAALRKAIEEKYNAAKFEMRDAETITAFSKGSGKQTMAMEILSLLDTVTPKP